MRVILITEVRGCNQRKGSGRLQLVLYWVPGRQQVDGQTLGWSRLLPTHRLIHHLHHLVNNSSNWNALIKMNLKSRPLPLSGPFSHFSSHKERKVYLPEKEGCRKKARSNKWSACIINSCFIREENKTLQPNQNGDSSFHLLLVDQRLLRSNLAWVGTLQRRQL